MRFNGTNEIEESNLVYNVGTVRNSKYHSWLFGMVSVILICHSWAVINCIFKNNTITVKSCSVPFIFSQMTISLKPGVNKSYYTNAPGLSNSV